MTDDQMDHFVEEDDQLALTTGNPTNCVKMTVTLPRSIAAFLRWKAETEGMRRDELLRRIISHYAKKLRAQDMNTPPISD